MSICKYINGVNSNYILSEEYINIIPFDYPFILRYDKIILYPKGALRIGKGYEWTCDYNFAVDSFLAYYALYELMERNILPRKKKKQVDECLKQMLINEDVSKWKANYIYLKTRFKKWQD